MIYVNLIKVCPSSISLVAGKWFCDINAEVLPANADNKEVAWYSDNPNIASINSSNGYIYEIVWEKQKYLQQLKMEAV